MFRGGSSGKCLDHQGIEPLVTRCMAGRWRKPGHVAALASAAGSLSPALPPPCSASLQGQALEPGDHRLEPLKPGTRMDLPSSRFVPVHVRRLGPHNEKLTATKPPSSDRAHGAPGTSQPSFKLLVSAPAGSLRLLLGPRAPPRGPVWHCMASTRVL